MRWAVWAACDVANHRLNSIVGTPMKSGQRQSDFTIWAGLMGCRTRARSTPAISVLRMRFEVRECAQRATYIRRTVDCGANDVDVPPEVRPNCATYRDVRQADARRRRRTGRGFAVEPAADAAPPAIDPPHALSYTPSEDAGDDPLRHPAHLGAPPLVARRAP